MSLYQLKYRSKGIITSVSRRKLDEGGGTIRKITKYAWFNLCQRAG